MKKQIHATIIATIATIMIILSCAVAIPATAEVGDRGEFYPRLTVVVDRIETKVYCRDRDGNIWVFFDEEEEWEEGDIANLLMWKKDIHENHDEIVEVYWEGYTENVEGFFSLEGWH